VTELFGIINLKNVYAKNRKHSQDLNGIFCQHLKQTDGQTDRQTACST